jgi:hypothetical protein
VSVAAVGRPPWLDAVVDVIGARVIGVAEALADYARAAATAPR